jgi:hypothetical protein
MNVSEITDLELELISSGEAKGCDLQLKALAQAELSRREKVEAREITREDCQDSARLALIGTGVVLACDKPAKVEIVKSCDNCGNGPIHSEKCCARLCHPFDTGSAVYLANWTPKPTERAEIEPSQAVMDAIQMESIEQRLHNLALSFNGLLERMDAIETPTERAEIEPWITYEPNCQDRQIEQLQRRLETVESEMRKR